MPLPHQFTLALRHLTPGRRIDGIAALPTPFDAAGRPDLVTLGLLVQATYAAGLTPAVNTFAGAVELLTPDERADVLMATAGVACGRRFVAGAMVEPGTAPLVVRCGRALDAIALQGGTPLLLQNDEFAAQDEERIVEVFRLGSSGHRGLLTVELGRIFGPSGRVYSLDLFHRLLDVPALTGLAHASLDRVQEWYRIEARDVRRPDFHIYSGNELAIDMVSYGSDYILGVAGCAPHAFAIRDRYWRLGDPRGFALNDLLQYLAFLVYRAPMAASRHSAIQFLHARGLVTSPHVRGERRAAADLPLLHDVAARLDALLSTDASAAGAAQVSTAGMH